MKTIQVKLYESNAESCMTNFGMELFGELYNAKGEPNTKDENLLQKQIKDYTHKEYGERTDPKFVENLKKLHKCFEQYPDVLKPETVFAYRGLTLPITEFKAMTGKDWVADLNGAPINFKYKPKQMVESWTDDFGSACFFADPNSSRTKSVGIVMGISVKKDKESFLFNVKHFSRLSEFGEMEREMLRFLQNEVRVTAICYDMNGYNLYDTEQLAGMMSKKLKK